MVVIRCHYLGLDLREEMGRMPGNARYEEISLKPRPAAPNCCSSYLPVLPA